MIDDETTRIDVDSFVRASLHISEFIQDELDARGWSEHDLAVRMDGDPSMNLLTVQMLMAVTDHRMLLDDETANGLSAAFGISPEYWIKLHEDWRRAAMRAEKEGLD